MSNFYPWVTDVASICSILSLIVSAITLCLIGSLRRTYNRIGRIPALKAKLSMHLKKFKIASDTKNVALAFETTGNLIVDLEYASGFLEGRAKQTAAALLEVSRVRQRLPKESAALDGLQEMVDEITMFKRHLENQTESDKWRS